MACTHASLELITWVQQSAPYWNMTQGENHFMVGTLSEGVPPISQFCSIAVWL